MVSATELHHLEQCGEFWSTVVTTFAIPIALSLFATVYIRGQLVYDNVEGGRIDYATVLGDLYREEMNANSLKAVPHNFVKAIHPTLHEEKVFEGTGNGEEGAGPLSTDSEDSDVSDVAVSSDKTTPAFTVERTYAPPQFTRADGSGPYAYTPKTEVDTFNQTNSSIRSLAPSGKLHPSASPRAPSPPRPFELYRSSFASYPPHSAGEHAQNCKAQANDSPRPFRLDAREVGWGTAMVLSWYPLYNFCWTVSNDLAFRASFSMMHKLFKVPLPEADEVSTSGLLIHSASFIVGLVGIIRQADTLYDGISTFVYAGRAPDLRVFLIISTIANVVGFTTGVFVALLARRESTRHVSKAIRKYLYLFWIFVSFMSFGVGCTQIARRQKTGANILALFVYWSPIAAQITTASLFGIRPFGILGIIGVVLGVITGNQENCLLSDE